MWELVKRSLQRERSMAGAQLGRPRKVSVQKVHNEIVEAFLKAGRQARRNNAGAFCSVDIVDVEGRRSMRGGIWRAVSNLGFAIAMAIRLLNPYVLISAAFGHHRSLFAHLSARVDSMRAVLSPRTGRRRRLTAWIQDTLPERHVPEAANAIWEDGSILCGIVETAVPGACPGYDALSHPNTDRSSTLWLGQKLAARYLGVPPVFNDDDLAQPFLSVTMERRLLRYLSAVRAAAARIENERQKRLKAVGNTPYDEEGLSSDCIVQSAINPGESMLECVARGMGLILGVKGRQSTFYLYLNPNHPHRHVHRLMKSSNWQPKAGLLTAQNIDDEAGAILMQIRGPNGDFGAALLSTVPGSSSSSKGSSMAILNEQWTGRIPITYETSEESVKVSFVPQTPGVHELLLLLRGGAHVPGSPFSVSVEDSLDVPDQDGKRVRFGSGRLSMWKSSSYESGLNKVHKRSNSGASDPGAESEKERFSKQRVRIVSRVVDFVSEKMILTEEGKLERLPRQSRRSIERPAEWEGVATTSGESPPQLRIRHFSTLSPSRSRIRYREMLESYHGTYPGRRITGDTFRTFTAEGADLEMMGMNEENTRCNQHLFDKNNKSTNMMGQTHGNYCNFEKGSIGSMLRVSDVAEHNVISSTTSNDFREHCRRILWLCDILLKHSPRTEGLEMLNTAGNILDGKRVHPTILEESEPEESTTPTPVGNSSVLVQRLQHTRGDRGGLNDVSGWKDSRRSLHTLARQDRGGGVMGGRLLHKGSNYRGIVVRNLNAEAITGAYAGGDDTKEEEDDNLDPEEEEMMKQYLLDEGSESRKKHHSLPKRMVPNHRKLSENRGLSMERLEPMASSQAETDPGTALTSGKDLNKSIVPKSKEQINYRDKKTKSHEIGGPRSDIAKSSTPVPAKKDSIVRVEGNNTTSVRISDDKSAPQLHRMEGKTPGEKDKPKNSDLIVKPRDGDAAHVPKAMEVSTAVSEEKSSSLKEKAQKRIKNRLMVNNEHKNEKGNTRDEKTEMKEELVKNKSIKSSEALNRKAIPPTAVDGKAQEEIKKPKEWRETNGRPFLATHSVESPEFTEKTDAERPSVAEGTLSSGSRFLQISPQRERKIEGSHEGSGRAGKDFEGPNEKTNLYGEVKATKEEKEVRKDSEKENQGKEGRITSYSYTQMVGRMLCTDSFSQESLEWFDMGEKAEEDLEGAMERMGEVGGGAGTGVVIEGEESWGEIGAELAIGDEEVEEIEDEEVVVEEDEVETEGQGGPDAFRNEDQVGKRLSPVSPDPKLGAEKEDRREEPRHKFSETKGKRAGVGVGVGVGVVVAGGILSTGDNRSQERRGGREDPTWYRGRERRMEGGDRMRLKEWGRQDSSVRQWDEISTGIDAMEDGSISGIIAGVRRAERKARTDEVREERGEVIGEKAIEAILVDESTEGEITRKKREDSNAEAHSVTEIPRDMASKEAKGYEAVKKRARGESLSGRALKEESIAAFERLSVAKGPESEKREESGRRKCDGEKKREIAGEERKVEWWLSEKREVGVGGKKIDDLGLPPGGKEGMAGKLGRETPGKGVEEKEDGEKGITGERKEVCGGESTQADHPHHKSIGGKEGLPSVSGKSYRDLLLTEKRAREGVSKGIEREVEVLTLGVESSLKHEEIESAEEADELVSGAKKSEKKREKAADEGKRVVSDEKTPDKGLKETEKVARVVSSASSEEKYIEGRGEKRLEKDKDNAKESLSTGAEVPSESAESENKYSFMAIKESLRKGGDPNDGTEGSTEDVDSMEREEMKGSGEEQRESSQVIVKSTKGILLGSVPEERDESSSQGAVEVGVEKVNNLLERLIEIPKDDPRTTEGSSPKREGEGIYGVKIALEDWVKDGSEESDYLGPETEVIVGDFEATNDGPVEEGKVTKGYEIHRRGRATVGRVVEITPPKDKTEKDEGEGEVSNIPKEGVTKNKNQRLVHGEESTRLSRKNALDPSDDVSAISDKKLDEGSEDSESEDSLEEFERDSSSQFEKGEHRSSRGYSTRTFPDLEDLIGTDFSFKMTSSTAQFNLWPSQEAFGDRRSPLDSIESFLSGQPPITGIPGSRILAGMTNFSKKTIIMGSSINNINKTSEKGKKEEEEILLIEQNFDDRSDETRAAVPPRPYADDMFDMQSHPRANTNDAFLIFESPGVTTFTSLNTDTKRPNERFTPVVQDGEIDSEGGWEEGVLFLDDEDEAAKQDGNRIWEIIDDTVEGAKPDTAYAVVTETDTLSKQKTPVLPTGRWCPRLSMLSPVMSAISEEDLDEPIHEKDITGKDGKGSKVDSKTKPGGQGPPHELPVLKIEVEDGFGESFTRRRSSTPSLVSDDSSGDCGAAFVVSSELAVTLALGVSITQIIPPGTDTHDLTPVLPQVEEAADALSIGKRDSDSGESSSGTEGIKVEKEGGETDLVPRVIKSSGSRSEKRQINADTTAHKKQEERAINRAKGGFNADGCRIRYSDKNETNYSSMDSNDDEGEWRLIDTSKDDYLHEEGDNDGRKTVVTQTSFESALSKKQTKTVGVGGEKVERVSEPKSVTATRRESVSRLRLENTWGSGSNKSVGNRNEPIVWDASVSDRSWLYDGSDDEHDKSISTKKNDGVHSENTKVLGGGSRILPLASDRTEERTADLNDFERGIIENSWRGNLSKFQEGTLGKNETENIGRSSLEKQRGDRHRYDRRDIERNEEGAVGGVSNKIEAKEISGKKCEKISDSELNRPFAAESFETSNTEVYKKKVSENRSKVDQAAIDRILGLTNESEGSDSSGNGKDPEAKGRRDSLFEDYRFDWWDRELDLKNKKPKSPDSTGLEYYIDVDQLLSLDLEATEAEVKYYSAKEIMEKFTKVIESPEKSLDSGASCSGSQGSSSSSSEGILVDIFGEMTKGRGIPVSNSKAELWGDSFYEDSSKKRPTATQETKKSKTLDDLLFGDDLDSSNEMSEEKKEGEHFEKLKEEEFQSPEVSRTAEHGQGFGKVGDEEGVATNETIFSEKSNWVLVENTAMKTKQAPIEEKRSWGIQSAGETSSRNFGGGIDVFENFDKSPERKDSDQERKVARGTEGDTSALISPFDPTPKKKKASDKVKTRSEVKSEFPETSKRKKSSSFEVDSGKKELKGVSPSRSLSVADPITKKSPKRKKEKGEKSSSTEKEIKTSKSKRDGEIIVETSEKESAAAKSTKRRSKKSSESKAGSSSTKKNVKSSQIEATDLNEDKIKDGSVPSVERRSGGEENKLQKEMGDAPVLRLAMSEKKNVEEKDGKGERVRSTIAESEKGIKSKELGRAKNKSLSQSASIEEYRSVVSEAYAFLDFQESHEEKIEEEDETKEEPEKEEDTKVEGERLPDGGALGGLLGKWDSWGGLAGEGKSWMIQHIGKKTFWPGLEEARGIVVSPRFAVPKDEDILESLDPFSWDDKTSSPPLSDVLSTKTEPSPASSPEWVSPKKEDGPELDEEKTPSKDLGNDDSFTTRTTVASRKEYWDKRVKEEKTSSDENPATPPRKPNIKVSGIVARSRMSFEQKDSGTESSDGGRSSGDTSSGDKPLGKHTSLSTGRKSLKNSPQTPSERKFKQDIEASEMQSSFEKQNLSSTNELERTSQAPVLKRKEIWDEKVKMEKEGTEIDLGAIKRPGKKLSERVESTEKMLYMSVMEDKVEKKVPSIRVKGIVSRSKLELENLSSSPPDVNKNGAEAVKVRKVRKSTDSSTSEEDKCKQKLTSKQEEPSSKLENKKSMHMNQPQTLSLGIKDTTDDKKSSSTNREQLQSGEWTTEYAVPAMADGGWEDRPSGIKRSSWHGEITSTEDDKDALKKMVESKINQKLVKKPLLQKTGKSGSLPTNIGIEEGLTGDASFVARRKKYWDTVRQSTEEEEEKSDQLKRKEFEEVKKEARGNGEMKKVKNLWERRASLDAIQLTEETKRIVRENTNILEKKTIQEDKVLLQGVKTSTCATSEMNVLKENKIVVDQATTVKTPKKVIAKKSLTDVPATAKTVTNKTDKPSENLMESSVPGEKKLVPKKKVNLEPKEAKDLKVSKDKGDSSEAKTVRTKKKTVDKETPSENALSDKKILKEKSVTEKKVTPKRKVISVKKSPAEEKATGENIAGITAEKNIIQEKGELTENKSTLEKKMVTEKTESSQEKDLPDKTKSPSKLSTSKSTSKEKTKSPAKKVQADKSSVKVTAPDDKLSAEKKSSPEKVTTEEGVPKKKVVVKKKVSSEKTPEKVKPKVKKVSTDAKDPTSKASPGKTVQKAKSVSSTNKLTSEKQTDVENTTQKDAQSTEKPILEITTQQNIDQEKKPEIEKIIQTDSKPTTDQKVVQENTPENKSSAAVATPPLPARRFSASVGTVPYRKEFPTTKEKWDSWEEEEKAVEYVKTRGKRDSLEIRVTDDEDICVLREITSVPRFLSKGQMETHAEEEETHEEEGGTAPLSVLRPTSSLKSFKERHPAHAIGIGDRTKSASLDKKGEDDDFEEAAKAAIKNRRRSMPAHSIHMQTSGMVYSGRRRISSENKPTAIPEDAAKTVKAAPRRKREEQRREALPPVEERLVPKEESWTEVGPKGPMSMSPFGASAEELGATFKAIPVHVEEESHRAEFSEKDLAGEIPSTLARGEGGDDGRSAISRRAGKGKAPMQKKKPPPSAASSPDSDSDAAEPSPSTFLSTPPATRRHSTDISANRPSSPLLNRRRGSGDLGSPRRATESKKRFASAKQFFESLEKDSPPNGSGGDDSGEKKAKEKRKKKVRGTTADADTGKGSSKRSSTKHRASILQRNARDSSESTPDSEKPEADSEKLQNRRKARRGSCDTIRSAPGSDVEIGREIINNSPHRRKKPSEFTLRSNMFGGSERQPRVSERFNVMDLFRDVAGLGTGGGSDLSGRATPLGIPHTAAVLAALRSVEDVRSPEAAASPYDLYRPIESANDCEPPIVAARDVNANKGAKELGEGNVTLTSSGSLKTKQVYQSEYPHLPLTSPRRSRTRSSNNDLIPRNVLLKLDNKQQNAPVVPPRRSKADLF